MATSEGGVGDSVTLRDFLAVNASEVDIDEHRKWHPTERGGMIMDSTREDARYAYADAMLAARSNA